MNAAVFHHILLGIGLGIRIVTVGMAVLLIIRSVMGRFLPLSLKVYMEPLMLFTDTFVLPIRYILPERIVKRTMDYSPLVAALLILLIGLGIEHLLGKIEIFANI